MKLHPVTNKLVPDETGRLELYRYVNPRSARWPRANFIVGNPPFIGNKRMKKRLGKGYVDAVRKAWHIVASSVDFVIYWWDIAAGEVAYQRARQAGFITTNSISQILNRGTVSRRLAGDRPVHIGFAIPDHPWRDTGTDAAIRIAMTVVSRQKEAGRLLRLKGRKSNLKEVADTDFHETRGRINADLTIGANVAATGALKANAKISQQGVILVGDGFRFTSAEMRSLGLNEAPYASLLRPYLIGEDLTDRPEMRFVADTYGLSERQLTDLYPTLANALSVRVKPERDENDDKAFKERWWLWGRARPEIREFCRISDRYIASCRTATHRVFQFLNAEVVPDAKIIAIGLEDAYHLGILSSRIHVLWANASGGWLGVGNDSNYNHSECFGKFPFAADVRDPLAARIRAEAEALDSLRKRVLAEHQDLTLTGLYNVLEALRDGRALTDKERDIHDRGLVTLIKQHHDAIDALVAEAYGWRAEHEAGTLTDAVILERLVALNKERAAEEARGIVRWLRPEFQAPGTAKAPVLADLDLGEAPVAAAATILPWPKTLPEQVSAVAFVLAGASAPMTPRDVAAAFKGKRAASVEPVLGALAAIGRARKLVDGRYAA